MYPAKICLFFIYMADYQILIWKKSLEELEESGFITAYSSIDDNNKNRIYRLSYFYTAFYFRFITKAQQKKEENYWLYIQNQPIFNAWKGIAFEQVCLSHVKETKSSLGISGVISNQDTWIGSANDQKVQNWFFNWPTGSSNQSYRM